MYLSKINMANTTKHRSEFYFTGIEDDLPDTVDWRTKNIVTGVKDQVVMVYSYMWTNILVVKHRDNVEAVGLSVPLDHWRDNMHLRRGNLCLSVSSNWWIVPMRRAIRVVMVGGWMLLFSTSLIMVVWTLRNAIHTLLR